MKKKVYIYALLDEEDNEIYVGKSTCPRERLIAHLKPKCVILDYFYDKEHYWINKLTVEGKKLKNKEKLKNSETWEVGDIIVNNYRKSKNQVRVKYLPTGKIYHSCYAAAMELGYPLSISHSLQNSPKSKYHDVFQLI